MNVIRCPKCKYELGERDASFEAEPDHRFKVACGKCGHVWSAHHADFYRYGTNGPELRNPFKPLYIVPT